MSQQVPPGFGHLSRFTTTDGMVDGEGNVVGGDGRAPTEAELANPVVAPGCDAVLPYGIEYQAPWESPNDGLARHARAQVQALSRAGLPVVLRRMTRPKMIIDDDDGYATVPHLTPSEKEAVLARAAIGRQMGYLRDLSVGNVLVAIRQLVFTSPTALENVIAPAGARLAGFDRELAVYKSTIVYTPWERSTVAPGIVEILNRCAEVWVQGNWAVEVFRSAGVQRVYSIPVPYDPQTSSACWISAPRGNESVPSGKRFYAIGKWEPRKNYDALLGAFLLEFKPTERVSLFLKTSGYGTTWKDYPNVGDAVTKWLGEPAVMANGWTIKQFNRAVRIASRVLPEDQIFQLHRDNNIYVSCSHAEGWDLPAFDARCAGNHLVYTGWSSPVEYAGEHDYRIHPTATGTTFEPVHPDYGWEPNAYWATASVDAIRVALRAAQPPEKRIHPTDFYGRFGMTEVGHMMATRIYDRFGEDVFTKLRGAGSFG